MHTLDHIVFAVADLDDGSRQLEEQLGVATAYGGHHPEGVTKNVLLSLGEPRYLELIALRDDIDTPEGREWMLEAEAIRPIGWAVASADLKATKDRLDHLGFETSDITDGARKAPDGTRLSWTTMGLTRRTVGAPFFIQWGDDTPHPSTTTPTGCMLTSLTVATPDHERLQTMLHSLDVDVRVITGSGPDAAFSVVVESPNGLVTLDNE